MQKCDIEFCNIRNMITKYDKIFEATYDCDNQNLY